MSLQIFFVPIVQWRHLDCTAHSMMTYQVCTQVNIPHCAGAIHGCDKLPYWSPYTSICGQLDDNLLPLKLKQYSKASSYAVYGSWNETCILKTMHHEVGKTSKNPRKIHIKCSKCWRYVDFTQIFGKNLRISTIFGTKIQNHLSSRSAQLETVYIEALLYPFKGIFVIDLIQKYHPF